MKCWTVNFCLHASEGPVIIMHQLKSVNNSPFKDSYSHPIRTCLSVIASNVILLIIISGGSTFTTILQSLLSLSKGFVSYRADVEKENETEWTSLSIWCGPLYP